MKIRLGFVSNSSNTSFCIYGKYFDYKDITEEIENKLSSLGLEIINDQNDCGKYIGRSFTTIKDDETGKEFKESTLKKIKEVFPQIEKLNVCEDGWYNG